MVPGSISLREERLLCKKSKEFYIHTEYFIIVVELNRQISIAFDLEFQLMPVAIPKSPEIWRDWHPLEHSKIQIN